MQLLVVVYLAVKYCAKRGQKIRTATAEGGAREEMSITTMRARHGQAPGVLSPGHLAQLQDVAQKMVDSATKATVEPLSGDRLNVLLGTTGASTGDRVYIQGGEIIQKVSAPLPVGNEMQTDRCPGASPT